MYFQMENLRLPFKGLDDEVAFENELCQMLVVAGITNCCPSCSSFDSHLAPHCQVLLKMPLIEHTFTINCPVLEIVEIS